MNAAAHAAYVLSSQQAARRSRDLELIRRRAERPVVPTPTRTTRSAHWLDLLRARALLRPAL